MLPSFHSAAVAFRILLLPFSWSIMAPHPLTHFNTAVCYHLERNLTFHFQDAFKAIILLRHPASFSAAETFLNIENTRQLSRSPVVRHPIIPSIEDLARIVPRRIQFHLHTACTASLEVFSPREVEKWMAAKPI